MIGIAAQTYDLEGARLFENLDRAAEQKNLRSERRVTRTATLDGGVSISDMGHAHGDRTITVTEPAAPIEAVDFARHIVETYALVNVAAADGAYSASPSAYAVGDDGALTITLLVKEKLSQ